MYKKIIISLIIILECFSFWSCNDLGIGDALALDENLHISFNHIDDKRIEFQGYIYYLSPISFLGGEKENLDATGDYEYMGWTGARFFYKSHIFGESSTASTFLYTTNTRETFLREDYDYHTDYFIIEGTDDIICFGDDLLDTDYANTNLFNRETKEITIASKSHPTLKTQLHIVIDGEKWYAISRNMIPFELSDNFINILKNNEIIT